MLSTMGGHEFLENYGVAIAEGPLAGVAARAVVVVDENDRVVHAQLVSENGEEPDYDAALAALAYARRSAAAQRHGRAARQARLAPLRPAEPVAAAAGEIVRPAWTERGVQAV